MRKTFETWLCQVAFLPTDWRESEKLKSQVNALALLHNQVGEIHLQSNFAAKLIMARERGDIPQLRGTT